MTFSPAAHLCFVTYLPSQAKDFGERGKWEDRLNITSPAKYVASPSLQRKLLITLPGERGGPIVAHLHTLHNLKACQQHDKMQQQQQWQQSGQDLFKQSCPPVIECGAWLSPASCFLHLRDSQPFVLWADKLRHLGSTSSTLNAGRIYSLVDSQLQQLSEESD